MQSIAVAGLGQVLIAACRQDLLIHQKSNARKAVKTTANYLLDIHFTT